MSLMIEQNTQPYLSQFLIVDNNDIRWAQVTPPGGHQPVTHRHLPQEPGRLTAASEWLSRPSDWLK